MIRSICLMFFYAIYPVVTPVSRARASRVFLNVRAPPLGIKHYIVYIAVRVRMKRHTETIKYKLTKNKSGPG